MDPVAPALTDPYVSAYVYVSNRATVLIDPTGEFGIDPGVLTDVGKVIVGTAKEVPGTVTTAIEDPATFAGTAASYSLVIGINYGAIRLLKACSKAETTLLDLLGKLDHPLACGHAAIYVSGASTPFVISAWLGSRAIANDGLGRTSK